MTGEWSLAATGREGASPLFYQNHLRHTDDLHATALSLPGLDHEKLTCRCAGRNFRLTHVYGKVAKENCQHLPAPPRAGKALRAG